MRGEPDVSKIKKYSFLGARTSYGATVPTNSVVHTMNRINKVFREFIPKKTMSFRDDILVKSCEKK